MGVESSERRKYTKVIVSQVTILLFQMGADISGVGCDNSMVRGGFAEGGSGGIGTG